jgi:hypothetical protein
VLDERGGSFKGRLWTYLDPLANQVVFDATRTHERDGPADFLVDFRGKLHADAYSGYDGLYADGQVLEIGCWAQYLERANIRSASTEREDLWALGHRPAGSNPDNLLHGLEEFEDLGRRAPSLTGVRRETSTFPKGVEDLALHLQVAGDVAAGGCHGCMPEVITDHTDVDTCLQQPDGAAVAQDMGCDATSSQVGPRACRSSDVLPKDVGNAVTCQWLAAGVTKDRLLWRIGPNKAAKGCRGFRPQRTVSFFSAFPQDTYLRESVESKGAGANRQGFTDARARVVEQ